MLGRSLASGQPSLWDDIPESMVDCDPSHASPERGLSGFQKVDWSFPNSTERGFTHGLHPWPAKFIPDIPATVIELLSEPGDTVLDPFCGCGTTAVEATVAGRGFIAADVNPLAVLITKGKCEIPGTGERLEITEWARGLGIQETSDDLLAKAPPIPNLLYWFDPPIIAQLAYILQEIRTLGIATAFLETVFSSIIVGVSHQESETRYRRVERMVSPENTLARFTKRLFQGLRMASVLSQQPDLHPSRSYQPLDARRLADSLPAKCASLSVFSPPYPNSFDYHLYHRFRMFWLGMDPRVVKHSEMGAHLLYQPDHEAWLNDMSSVFKGIAHCLVENGHAVCVVGNGLIRGRIVPSGDLLWEMAPSADLTPKWRTTRLVPRSRKSFNLSDSRLGREEVLVFQR